METVFTLNAENETVKELDWNSARLEAQQAAVQLLVNGMFVRLYDRIPLTHFLARKAPTTQSVQRLLTLASYVFHAAPNSLVTPHASQLYELFYHDNTDVQKWAHSHLSQIVSIPVEGKLLFIGTVY